ncbi:MAG: fibronectin type III domain-containing protein, partial [Patescibacteria group bacterium]
KFEEIGKGVIRGLLQQGAGASGVVPPGLLITPDLRKDSATTSIATGTLAVPVIPTQSATTTSATTTPAIPAIPATPATPATPAQPTTTTTTDTTPPTASISSNGEISYSSFEDFSVASSDNVGVVGIQFKKNGVNFGSEIIATSTASLPSTYEFTWDATNEANGSYIFSAVVRDAAGNAVTVYANTVTLNKTSTSQSTASTTSTATTDITAPTVSSVTTVDITTSGATITWITDEPADSQVEYGLNNLLGNLTTLNTSLVTSHSITLTGLNAGTTYHYRIKSKDAAGYFANAIDYTFTTTGSAPVDDYTRPIISSVTATDITNSGATITWITDEPSTSRVEYGLTTSYGSFTSTNTSLVTTHSVTLTGLNPGTVYHYVVTSKDLPGNSRDSGDYTFTTSPSVSSSTTTTATTTMPVVQNNLSSVLDSLILVLQKLQVLLLKP